jgi:hypothetical protein
MSDIVAQEIEMRKTLLALLFLSLTLTGCIVAPDGYRDRQHGDYHSDRGDWPR